MATPPTSMLDDLRALAQTDAGREKVKLAFALFGVTTRNTTI